MIGERFGRLIVVERVGSDKFKQTLWKCKCDCGNETITSTNRLKMGKTKSCGCLKREGNNRKHGMCYTRLNKIYRSMKQRCYSKSYGRYEDYGGRGISVCDEWLGKYGFDNFAEWSANNGYDDSKSIDRKDNDKGYSPENCRWTDSKTQANNTRRNLYYKIDGVSHTLAEWSEIYGIEYAKLYARVMKLGWSIEKAVKE